MTTTPTETIDVTDLPTLAYMAPLRAERQGYFTAILTAHRIYLRWHSTRRSPIRNIIGELSDPRSTFTHPSFLTNNRVSLIDRLRVYRPAWFVAEKHHTRNIRKPRTFHEPSA